MGAPDDAGTGKARSSRLEIITNLAILATLLFLLLNPSGIIGRWIGRQFAETRERNAVTSLWSELTDSGSGRLGEKDVGVAEPIIVEFLDYQCPACRAVAPHVSKAMEDGSVSIVVRHLPLEEIHPIAREAAKAVVCAERQGIFRGTGGFEAAMEGTLPRTN